MRTLSCLVSFLFCTLLSQPTLASLDISYQPEDNGGCLDECRVNYNVAYPENGFGGSPYYLNSSDACCRRCTATLGCVAFVYHSNRRCFLKNAVGEPVVKIGVVSRNYKEPIPADNCYAEYMVNREGGNIEHADFPTNSPADCCAVCKSTDECVAWTWMRVEGRCYLKNAVTDPIVNDYGVSGVVWRPQ